MATLHTRIEQPVQRELVGVDVFVYSKKGAKEFQEMLVPVDHSPFKLQMISNRGVRIWPEGQPETFCIEQYRARFIPKEKMHKITFHEITQLLEKLHFLGHDIIKVENLYTFDKAPGFSSAQG